MSNQNYFYPDYDTDNSEQSFYSSDPADYGTNISSETNRHSIAEQIESSKPNYYYRSGYDGLMPIKGNPDDNYVSVPVYVGPDNQFIYAVDYRVPKSSLQNIPLGLEGMSAMPQSGPFTEDGLAIGNYKMLEAPIRRINPIPSSTPEWATLNDTTLRNFYSKNDMEKNPFRDWMNKNTTAPALEQVTPPMARKENWQYPPTQQPAQQRPAPQPQAPQTESSIMGGIKTAGERLINDWNYNLGMAQKSMGEETQKGIAYEKAIPNLANLNRMSDNQLQMEINRRNNEITSRNSTETNSILRGEAMTPVIETRQYNPSDAQLQQNKEQLWTLQEIQRQRAAGRSTAQIQQSMQEYSRNGGPGSARMNQARNDNNALPQTQGMGTVGEIGAGIIQSAIPIVAGMVSGGAGLALGAANVTSMAGQNVASTQIEMDNYEKSSGIKIPDGDRAAYTIGTTVANMAIDGALQGRYLGRLITPKGQLGKELITPRNVIPNTGSQLERRIAEIAPRGMGNRIIEMGKDALVQGGSETAGAVIQDATGNVYRQDGDKHGMNEIYDVGKQAAIQGITTGAGLGALSGMGKRIIHDRRRDNQGVTIIGNTAPNQRFEIINQGKNGGYNIMNENGRVEQLPPNTFIEYYPVRNDDLNRIRNEREQILYPDQQKINYLERNQQQPEPPAKNGETSNANTLFRNINLMNKQMKETGIYPPKESIQNIVGKNRNEFYRKIYELIPESERPILPDSKGLNENQRIERSIGEYISILPKANSNPEVWSRITNEFNKIAPQPKDGQRPYNQQDTQYIIWQDLNGASKANTLEEMGQRSLDHQKVKQRLYGVGDWIETK